jgi:predicted RecB family nuclease
MLFQPLLFNRYEEITSRLKLLLGFRAALVGAAIGVVPTHGLIISGRDFKRTRISLPLWIPKSRGVMHDLNELAKQTEPPLFLCSHCRICEFRTKCVARAVEEDNISRLEGMSRSQIEEQHRKGIFTLHQYSHTFRPRKPPKRAKNVSTPRYFALQARAIRDKKLYIHGKATLPLSSTSMYLDIEGIPGRQFQYLFGLLTVRDGVDEYKPFWVNSESDEIDVFIAVCECVASMSGASLFHYGNYEMKVLNEMKRRVGIKHSVLIDRVIGQCCNVLSIVHRHCYFPTYSNGLKEVAGCLGYRAVQRSILSLQSNSS